MIIVGFVLSLFGVGFLCCCCSRSPSTRRRFSRASLLRSPHSTTAPRHRRPRRWAYRQRRYTRRQPGRVRRCEITGGSRRDRPPHCGACGRRGFHATLGLAQIGVSSEIWRHLSAVVGGVIVGFTAFVRLARTASLTSHERSIVLISAQPPSPPLAPSTTGD
jgi:hypothetical protein